MKTNKKFSKEKFIAFYTELLKQDFDKVVLEVGAGFASKFARTNFGFMEGCIETICFILKIELIKVHCSWSKTFKKNHNIITDTPKEKATFKKQDAFYLYQYAKEKELI